MKLRDWVRLPAPWMEERGLRSFQWSQGGSTNTAALMLLLVIAHHANDEDGVARLSYDQLEAITGMSRTKISDGLELLEKKERIRRRPEGRSTYQLAEYDLKRGWAMLPAKGLYVSGRVPAFHDFHLRKSSELDALKAYLAFAARRNNDLNAAFMTYEQIMEFTGIQNGRVTTALSILAVGGLVHVQQQPSKADPSRIANSYRLTHLHPRRHPGTIAREELMSAVEVPQLH